MALKKQEFTDDEIPIFEDALVYKRGDYWQMRMWLAKEHKYARFSLKTRNKSTAIDKAKLHYHELMAGQLAGKNYFSITTRMGVEKYLEQRQKDVDAGLIVSGRHKTISTHLNHWLNFIGKDVKLKELERTDCENYFHHRTKTKRNLSVSQTTIENEQSTINAMMAWLYKHKETHIDGFDFKKLKKVDSGIEQNRRATFTDDEIKEIKFQIDKYILEAEKNIDENGNLIKAIAGYYLMISLISGLRRGEQLQLKWKDIREFEHNVGGDEGKYFNLVKITVRGETSKVRKTRIFVIEGYDYFDGLLKLQYKIHRQLNSENSSKNDFPNSLMFSLNGGATLTPRSIGYHFDKIMELAEIKERENRDLVPYSFRHYFITKRVNSNLPPAAVAEMCGTSITQIEKTYYHTTEAKMISNALADYEYVDGILVPKRH
jgi:integrase